MTLYKTGEAKPTFLLLEDKNYNYVIQLNTFKVYKILSKNIKKMPFVFCSKRITNKELFQYLPLCPCLLDVPMFYKPTNKYKICKINIDDNNIDLY